MTNWRIVEYPSHMRPVMHRVGSVWVARDIFMEGPIPPVVAKATGGAVQAIFLQNVLEFQEGAAALTIDVLVRPSPLIVVANDEMFAPEVISKPIPTTWCANLRL
ncbi:hypothetical protein P3T76_003861 [Phytophthora citrophthora]|uniref:Uncharacterized protein n=1 Tax=Phytophthora citrophthora TaxID=4793 RepID=A0AAD9GW74_9STRA|nr:hypothetical protein P3T76_003861 [Phytophthora citrophthora]